MSSTQFVIQDPFLNVSRQQKVPVTIFLTNGFQLRGRIIGFDGYVVLIESTERKQQMVYKHAISTIVPAKPVRSDENPREQEKKGKAEAATSN